MDKTHLLYPFFENKQDAVTHKDHYVLSTFNSLPRAYSKDVEFALLNNKTSKLTDACGGVALC